MAKQVGEKHWSWKGNKAGYRAIHIWINKYFKKLGKCEKCGTTKAKRTEWANLSGKYYRDIKDYIELCPSCHRLKDRGNHCRNGHEFTEENTWLRVRSDILGTDRKIRVCRECQRNFSRNYQSKKRILK